MGKQKRKSKIKMIVLNGNNKLNAKRKKINYVSNDHNK